MSFVLRVAPTKAGTGHLRNLRSAPKRVRNAIPQAWHDAGGLLRKDLHKLLTTGARTGRLYMYRGQPYRASAPGEPPAKRSGRLARSSAYNVSGLQMEFGETAPYAGYLEEGTKKMAPRPHVSRVVKRTTGDVYQLLAKHISETLRTR